MHIGVVNAAKIVNMQSNAKLLESVLDSDVIFADGMSVVWAGRLLGQPIVERIAGIDLMHGILRRGNSDGYRIYCFGATQEVIDKVAAEIARKYPGVILAGARSGYFADSDEAGIAEQIRLANADVLFVGITSPKKEVFLSQWSGVMQVPVTHGVGGSFDVMAGKVKRAPEWWQRHGMEWLYRVLQEPGRLWKRYLITNIKFANLVLRSRFQRR
jgi:N-acetylglucosaminyldiphosphoundecaprenol N-acetyl-beta-D-mannosaminyltransferase